MRIDVAAGSRRCFGSNRSGGREGVADLVVVQRDGGHRGELRGAAKVEALASMKSGGQIQSNGPIDTGPATTAAA